MKKFLGAAAILAVSTFSLSGAANAAPLSGAAPGAPAADAQVQQVDFRPFRHCHGPRWDRRCHGGVFFLGRDRDRWRHRDRYYDRDYDRRRFRRDRYYD